MPLREALTFILLASAGLAAAAGEQTYYVDEAAGSDEAAGNSEQAAWKSLERVNRRVFLPGDGILLKAGCVWSGQLKPYGQKTRQGVGGDGKRAEGQGKFLDKDEGRCGLSPRLAGLAFDERGFSCRDAATRRLFEN